jgi:hypothetical protein
MQIIIAEVLQFRLRNLQLEEQIKEIENDVIQEEKKAEAKDQIMKDPKKEEET